MENINEKFVAVEPCLGSIKHMVKTYIHYNIVNNSSLHHAIHPLKSTAYMENQKNKESHSHRNVHDENHKQRVWNVISKECAWRKPI